jgi:hypothetical protein
MWQTVVASCSLGNITRCRYFLRDAAHYGVRFRRCVGGARRTF